MTTTSRHFLIKVTLTALLLLTGCEAGSKEFQIGGYSYDTTRFEQWKLPHNLREISGLAETADGHLFAHADEEAVVHQLDYQNGKRLKSYALGHRARSTEMEPAKGDFEGIAIAGEIVYLVTSQGMLYASGFGIDGSTVTFETHATGLQDICEVEGLAYHADLQVLLVACKVVHSAALRDKIVVFQWSIDRQSLMPEATISLPTEMVLSHLAGAKDFNPSGITVSPRNGNLLLVGARQHALLEMTIAGKLVRVFTLPMQDYHRQAEGIALFADGTLILADEGGKKRGRLGVYRATE